MEKSGSVYYKRYSFSDTVPSGAGGLPVGIPLRNNLRLLLFPVNEIVYDPADLFIIGLRQ